MANFKLLILVASAAFFTLSAHAGYAQLSPPSGWSNSASGAIFKSSANSSWLGSIVRGTTSLSLGGRIITVPYSLRPAANAARYLAGFITLNPYLRTGLAIAAWVGMANVHWSDSEQSWVETQVSQGYSLMWAHPFSQFVYGNGQSACKAYEDMNNTILADMGETMRYPTLIFQPSGTNGGHCHDGNGNSYTTVTAREELTDMAQEVPVSPGYVANKMSDYPMPQNVPEEMPPGIAIPVSDPVVNPSSDPIPTPQPMRVPMGDPVPVPNSDPQQWRTPVVDIYPSPTTLEPWRVDVRPNDVVRDSPDPITDPMIDPSSPSNQTPEKTPGLCEQFPDILACQKPNFDTPNIDQIQTKDAVISITPDSGWGADNAVCPAPRQLVGVNAQFDFDLMCQFMSGIRPVIIAIAWLSAAMILIGFKRGE